MAQGLIFIIYVFNLIILYIYMKVTLHLTWILFTMLSSFSFTTFQMHRFDCFLLSQSQNIQYSEYRANPSYKIYKC